jgi:hypothetical protein
MVNLEQFWQLPGNVALLVRLPAPARVPVPHKLGKNEAGWLPDEGTGLAILPLFQTMLNDELTWSTSAGHYCSQFRWCTG